MSDLSETFKAMREEKQKRNTEWYEQNMAILRTRVDIDFRVTNGGETLVFREDGKPRVDFYPSTGRWKLIDKRNRMCGGGAEKFLAWYEKQDHPHA